MTGVLAKTLKERERGREGGREGGKEKAVGQLLAGSFTVDLVLPTHTYVFYLQFLAVSAVILQNLLGQLF